MAVGFIFFFAGLSIKASLTPLSFSHLGVFASKLKSYHAPLLGIVAKLPARNPPGAHSCVLLGFTSYS